MCLLSAVLMYLGVCRAGIQAADRSCLRRSHQLERLGGQAHFRCRTSFTEKGQRLTPSLCRGLGPLPEEPQQAATAVGQITCPGHMREAAQQTQTDCPHQPASGPPFCTKPCPSPDPASWCARLENYGSPWSHSQASPLFPACFPDSNLENRERQEMEREPCEPLISLVMILYGQGAKRSRQP